MYSEVNEKHRLYNAGDRISETMQYSLPDGHDIHCVARWSLEAAEKEFFVVPRVLIVGDAQIHVHFLETILRPDRFGGRGVVLVDANYKFPADKDEAEALPVAHADKEAIAKGTRHWERYIDKVAQQWIDQCNAARSAGGVPAAASGFVVRALKLRGLADPASAVLMAAKENKSEIESLKETLAKQQELIDSLLTQKAGKGKANQPSATA